MRGCEKRKRDPWETLKRIIKATIKGFLMSFHMRIAMFLPWMMEIACDTNCEGAPWFWLCEGFSKTQCTSRGKVWRPTRTHHGYLESLYLFILFYFIFLGDHTSKNTLWHIRRDSDFVLGSDTHNQSTPIVINKEKSIITEGITQPAGILDTLHGDWGADSFARKSQRDTINF